MEFWKNLFLNGQFKFEIIILYGYCKRWEVNKFVAQDRTLFLLSLCSIVTFISLKLLKMAIYSQCEM